MTPKIAFTFLVLLSTLAHGIVPSHLEPDYAEAIIAFREGNFPGVMDKLAPLLKELPDQKEFLELQALTLKNMGADAKAEFTYKKLIGNMEDDGEPATEVAPLRFELGLILFKKKQLAPARAHLEAALATGFNIPACEFFLGVINLLEKKPEDAEALFRKVASSDAESLRPAAFLYLAQMAGQRADTAVAVRHLIWAKDLASRQLNDDRLSDAVKAQAKEALKSVKAAMASVDRTMFLAYLTMAVGHDSNVLLVPDSAASTAGASQKSSIKGLIQGTVGMATSPLNEFQFLPLYRGSVNYNFNKDTKEGQFLVHDLSVIGTHNPLSRSPHGLKVGTLWTFRNTAEPSSGNYRFAPYSLLLTAGPFLKHRWDNLWVGEMEAYFQSQKFNGDDGQLDEDKRSGWDANFRMLARSDKRKPAINPGIALVGGMAKTQGQNFRSKRVGLELSNWSYPSSRVNLRFTGGFTYLTFDERPTTKRTDQNIFARFQMFYDVTPHVQILGDLMYLVNKSDDANFQYNRLVSALGLSLIL